MHKIVHAARRQHQLRARFADQIKQMRLTAGISQAELGEAIAVTGSQISRFEAGINDPTLPQAMLLLEHLQPPQADLFASILPSPLIGVGFYGRDAARQGSFEADDGVKAACGLPATAPSHLSWGDDWLTRIHADDRPRVNHELIRLQADGVFAMPYRLVGLDGIERYIVDYGRIIYADDGKPKRLKGMMLNLTCAPRSSAVERKIAQIIQAMQ